MTPEVESLIKKGKNVQQTNTKTKKRAPLGATKSHKSNDQHGEKQPASSLPIKSAQVVPH